MRVDVLSILAIHITEFCTWAAYSGINCSLYIHINVKHVHPIYMYRYILSSRHIVRLQNVQFHAIQYKYYFLTGLTFLNNDISYFIHTWFDVVVTVN